MTDYSGLEAAIEEVRRASEAGRRLAAEREELANGPVTIQDVRLAKCQLEEKIAGLLHSFASETGLKVDGVYVDRVETFEGVALYQVEVEAKL